MTVLGSYAVHNNTHEALQMVVIGGFAWVVARFGFTASPIVLGLILGSIAEGGFVQGHMIGTAKGSVLMEFFGRPITMVIIVMLVLGLLYPLLSRRAKKKERVNEQ
jgi:putative tricarboxylic transport membrane protein